MPKHTTFLTYLLYKLTAKPGAPGGFQPETLGPGIVGKLLGHPEPATYHELEPVVTVLIYMAILVVAALSVRAKLRDSKRAVIPSDRFTLTTVFEVFFGYYYNLTKEVMGGERAKEYFPIVGASAGFITFASLMGLIPGIGSPTANLNVTLGCALVVFVVFNYYGFRKQGWGYLAHMAGPMPVLAPLIFTIEIISTCIRVLTLSIRLMVNIAVDHLLVVTFMGLVALLVPVPVLILEMLVCFIQGLVFSLLTAVYIGLATEDAHEEGHGEAHAH
jgi:F-type H+-transporting ATPase subunit a